ncbi:MAG: DNA methyltransferase [Tissierellia bacterium]|nr:DNA methyltransferase [Tissierellia bacterium]
MKAEKLGNITLYNADCMEVMKTFKDKQFDLAIIDTPYGIGEDGSKNHSRGLLAKSKNYKGYAGGDKEPPPKEYWDELFRVSKNQIIWGANHFISRIPYDSPCWVVWDKDNGETDFADCELAWTSFDSAVRKFKWRWQGMLQQNMKNKQDRIHPNEKPIQLYKWILQNYAKQGDTILDTHFGSLSIGIACHDLGFELTAIELDKDYYEAGKKRLREHQRQLTIF